MAAVTVEPAQDLEQGEVVALYESVGWSAYTRDPSTLMAALAGSSYVVAARLEGVLVGLARVVTDGVTICYLQDVLVHPAHQRSGTGRALVRAALEPYSSVRQTVLLTDAEPAQQAFYESLGFREARDVTEAALRAFVRFA
jgi:ribosomal protein S18 acetylase RimI-like enzyme